MRITDMHITPIAIVDPPLLNAAGLHAPTRCALWWNWSAMTTSPG
ncbi:MAG: hypothetical protein R2873_05340 [Caldilineaceae bacterium]